MKLEPEQTAKWQLTHLLCVDHFILRQVLYGSVGGGPGWGRETRRRRVGGPGPGFRRKRSFRLNEVIFFGFLELGVGTIIYENIKTKIEKLLKCASLFILHLQTFVAEIVPASSSIARRTSRAWGPMFVRCVAPPVPPDQVIENNIH